MKQFVGFYRDYTRFETGKLQLSYYGVTLWRRGRPPMNLNLQRLSGHLEPKYCAAHDSASQKNRATLSQTLYKGTARKSCHSPAATY